MKLIFNFLRWALICAVFSGCMRAMPQIPSPSPEKPLAHFYPVDASRVEFADDLDFALLEAAIERSINYYENAGSQKIYQIAGRQVDAAKLKETLIAFNEVIRQPLTTEELKQKICADFDVYATTGSDTDKKALFTGYYEPLLAGSLTPTERYRYPLYRPPPDLIARKEAMGENVIGRVENGDFVAYYSRGEIDIDGVLRGKGLELIWVDDAVELFTLHVQGSGKIRLEDGRLLTVTYAQNNGRPFRSVTRHMLDTGRISGREASYLNFKNFLKRHSDEELFRILSHNERYIFFRFTDGEPVGSLGEPVTPDRTIATDPDYFPEGALAFIRLRKPVFDEGGNIARRIPFARFVLSQDKGSAIKGPGRVDLFCGFGEKARATAGSLKEHGELYLLIKK
ncbi:MAG TPA: MltA domain-containing protein [Smithellaceae bacterium]|mgnify:CR=1 FL=1|nr:MltA domain-containing protein [Smithellaceae bacterium]HRS89040.1 MltA domain-containing protein [Smithellaceae bacterium]HRV25088.1 MltA domain-containing protein [Smithellaceae bacterium]